MIELSVQSINEKAPYKVHATQSGTLEFITENGGRYEVGFVLDDTLSADGIYQIFILENTGNHLKRDIKVRETVTAIIEELFKDRHNSLLYLCDTSDGRQALRNRLFSMWFNLYHYKNQYNLMTSRLSVEDNEYYFSMIVHADNPELQNLVSQFDTFTEFLKSKI